MYENIVATLGTIFPRRVQSSTEIQFEKSQLPLALNSPSKREHTTHTNLYLFAAARETTTTTNKLSTFARAQFRR